MWENHRNIHKICILLICILLLGQYYLTSPYKILIQNPQFSLLEPSNKSQIGIDDHYDELLDIKNFSFTLNPQPCQDYPEGLFLLIIVSSNPKHIENRKIIRETWGQTSDSTKLIFLLGEITNQTLADLILEENILYGDLVQGTFIDAYRNMTYKHVMGLKWVTHHCSNAKYIFKSDDDIAVSSNALKRFLARTLSPWGAKGLILCPRSDHALVQRADSKWVVTKQEYEKQFYPSYCAGYAILYSQDVIPKLLKEAQQTPYFWIDDVYVTGIVAQSAHIIRTQASPLVLTMKKAKLLMFLGPEYIRPFLFGPRDISVKFMSRIWSYMPN